MLLASLIALRALVPVGYILSVPTAAGGALALALCPLQNAALDLTLLSGADADDRSAHHHHHHSHHGHGPEDGAVSVSSADCSLWLASAAPAAPSLALPAPADAATPAAEPRCPWLRPKLVPFQLAQPRAPPTTLTA